MAIFIQRFLSFLLIITFYRVRGYVPASPTNDTTAIQQAMNVTGASKLHLQWCPNGSYWENVSYQLVAANSTGISQGALVHFSEKNVTNITLPTLTPWIALVSCDYNATDASQEEDVFTLARDLGAVSALLYSLYSQACIINPAYEDPSVFNQILDIFTTQSLTSAHLIESEFGLFGTNDSVYNYYNSQLLNESFIVVNDSINVGNAIAPGYLLATLVAYNATITPTSQDGDQETGSATPNNSSNTGLAMIILYAITGCVSALFCIVIISGAIRAIRHPDRYGPRVAMHHGVGGVGQSRARGLTRAILDTFPIVKFASANNTVPAKDPEEDPPPVSDTSQNQSAAAAVELSDLEGQLTVNGGENNERVELPVTTMVEDVGENEGQNDRGRGSRGDFDGNEGGWPKLGAGEAVSRSGEDIGEGPSCPLPPPPRKDVVPDAIGRETCPICIVDFAEGDDLRLLPCEGKHRFHQECVDPWLLELSSSCPICRQDFQALETMLSGESEDGEHWQLQDTRRTSGVPSQGNRFSRYLRSARLRNRAQGGSDTTDLHSPGVDA